MSVGIELHGPLWFWIVVAVYWIAVAPLVAAVAEVAVKNWHAGPRQSQRRDR